MEIASWPRRKLLRETTISELSAQALHALPAGTRISLLRFHTSSLSDTTVAAPTKKMDPATTYVLIVALFVAAGVLEIGARPRGNQNPRRHRRD